MMAHTAPLPIAQLDNLLALFAQFNISANDNVIITKSKEVMNSIRIRSCVLF